jgi:hypothetical protein
MEQNTGGMDYWEKMFTNIDTENITREAASKTCDQKLENIFKKLKEDWENLVKRNDDETENEVENSYM